MVFFALVLAFFSYNTNRVQDQIPKRPFHKVHHHLMPVKLEANKKHQRQVPTILIKMMQILKLKRLSHQGQVPQLLSR
jgi:hypothetical protein